MGKRILLVDDDPVIRALVGDYLAAFGHTVELADSGTECLASLDRSSPDLIFLDLQMPDMTGFEVLKRMIGTVNENLPVVMLSANENSHEEATVGSRQPNAYLAKPFDFKELLSVVDRLG